MNKLTATTTSQLVFYTLTSYAGTAVRVDYGDKGSVADSASAWDLQSVAVGNDGLQAFLFSKTNISDASMSYTGHVDTMIAEDIPDLHAKLGSPQYGISYLGVDTHQASRVVVAMSVAEGGADALACNWIQPGGTDSVTTFSRNGVNGTLGFVKMADGSSEKVSCKTGVFNTDTGTVSWSNVESQLTLTRSAGKIAVTGATNFPEGWSFGEPVQQPDGSWLCTLSDNAAPTEKTVSVSTDKTSIADDGVDTATLTATVTDSTTGDFASGVTVSWSCTSPGVLSTESTTTNSVGEATAILKGNGTPGDITVTASLENGAKDTVNITASADGTPIIRDVLSDRIGIWNNGSQKATISAYVIDTDGNPMPNQKIVWDTTLGTLSPWEGLTNLMGVAETSLTDKGDTAEYITVTAMLAENFHRRSVDVELYEE